MLLAKLYVSTELYKGFERGSDRVVLELSHGPLARHLAEGDVDSLLQWLRDAFPEIVAHVVLTPAGGIIIQLNRV
jgi:hypothetical protein